MALWFCACTVPQKATVEMSRDCCKNSAESIGKSTKSLKEIAVVYDKQYTGVTFNKSVEFCAPGCDPFKFQRFIYLAAEGKVQVKLLSVKSIDSQKQTIETAYSINNIGNRLKDRQTSVNYPPLYLHNQVFLI